MRDDTPLFLSPSVQGIALASDVCFWIEVGAWCMVHELGAYAGKSSDCYRLRGVGELGMPVCSDEYITHLTFIFLQEH